MKLLEFIATAVTLIGVYLISDQQYVYGWGINAAGDILWMWWGAIKSAHYLVALQLILFVIALNGLQNAL